MSTLQIVMVPQCRNANVITGSAGRQGMKDRAPAPFGWSSRLAFVLLCLWNNLVQGRQSAAVTGAGELLSRRGNRVGRRHQCGFVTNLQIDALDDFQDFP